MNQPGPSREYPNVKARLRLSRRGPGLPLRESSLDIWMNGTRFRVRDEAGRHVGEILGDLSEPRGLGVPARTMEEIMDVRSRARAPARAPSELYGDLATGEGWVRRGSEDAWPMPAGDLAPAAEQVLAAGRETALTPRGQTTRLGRPATEYQGIVKGTDDGAPYRSDVTLVVSAPYLLLSDVRDARHANHFYSREIVSLEEGTVSDADLAPP